jgi:hypothetical protein
MKIQNKLSLSFFLKALVRIISLQYWISNANRHSQNMKRAFEEVPSHIIIIEGHMECSVSKESGKILKYFDNIYTTVLY